MSRLLNALLDISKLESGAIQPEVIDFALAPCCEELRQEFAGVARNKGLQLRVECRAANVRSDPALIEQILRNLLSNAVKYTQKGYVTLRSFEEAGITTIEVLDTGIGMAADQIPYIYGEFFRIKGSTRGPGDGYGLGLTIVSRLVKLLALQLDVHSEPGKGTTFRLRIPASPAHAAARTIAAAPTAAARNNTRARRHILLVEDDAGVRDATRMLLAAEGFAVTTAASHEEALQKLAQSAALDLLISDYHLGGTETGAQVIASVRARLGAHLKAILVTGDTSLAIKNLHLDRLLRLTSKPVQADQLLLLIRELLGS
jgi:CheY-like chemotaxis protein